MTCERGFTLVEMLAALVVGSLLLVSLGWMTSSLGAELRRSPSDQIGDTLSVVSPTIITLLEGALPSEADGSGFDGDAEHLHAVIAPPQALGAVGPIKLNLETRVSLGGEALLISLSPVDESISLPASIGAPRVLVADMRQIEFSYVRSPSVSGSRLPKLITMTFRDTKNGPRSIIVAPRITGNGSCHFDPISMACR